MRFSFTRLLLCLVIGAGIGTLLAQFHVQMDSIYMFIGLFAVIFLAFYGYTYYRLYNTKDLKWVDKYIRDNLNNPYYAYLHHYVEGDLSRAEESIRKLKPGLKNDLIRDLGLIAIYMETKRYEEARRLSEQLSVPDARHYSLGLIALVHKDWDEYAFHREQLKDKRFRQIFETEEAFHRGDLKKAKETADRLLAQSGGITRYLLVKGIERSENDPDRTFYF
ncbi:hypothetical protein [Brevibacillus dissolubilis]|uniref:hypothetical protein n=1 Tax=Brevibacillus dissolubilis TaxID=1844116 RepID=UPI00111669C8|nr:hypothetical protein [Brevibacillus dissolubilis]